MYTPHDVSVIICAFSLERWNDLLDAVKSVREQTQAPRELIVVIDHNAEMLERVRRELPGVISVENRGPQGASSSRNSGVAVAGGGLVVFLDDDAVATPNWLVELCAGFTNSAVIGVGGIIEPLWSSHRPRWFPQEFDWVIGGTHRGMPETITSVRNVWSGNMAIRSEVFRAINGFRLDFGKVGTRSSPEDTDLCIRALEVAKGSMWLYKPDARVFHKVPTKREHSRYFFWRCYNEGLGKADLARTVGAQNSTNTERAYALQVLPKGVLRGLSDTFLHRDPSGVLRSGAIVIGLGLTMTGYVVETLKVNRKGTLKQAVTG